MGLGHRLEVDATHTRSVCVLLHSTGELQTSASTLLEGFFHSADNSSSRVSLLSYIILPQLIALEPKVIFLFKVKINALQHPSLLSLFLERGVKNI